MRRLLLGFAVVSLSLPAFAKSGNDRASVGDDITISEGETAGDVACAFCSVHVHGEVTGDVAVAFGDITVDPGKSIGGDVAMLGGNLNLGAGSWVKGDVAIAAGDVMTGDGAMIHGSRAVAPSKIWLILPFAPLLILAGLIWLIVWVVRRNRYQFPVYPQGRRF
jgi:predicted acyltransferase (DUF342 family)